MFAVGLIFPSSSFSSSSSCSPLPPSFFFKSFLSLLLSPFPSLKFSLLSFPLFPSPPFLLSPPLLPPFPPHFLSLSSPLLSLPLSLWYVASPHLLCSGSRDNSVSVWDVDTGTSVSSMHIPRNLVRVVADLSRVHHSLKSDSALSPVLSQVQFCL